MQRVITEKNAIEGTMREPSALGSFLLKSFACLVYLHLTGAKRRRNFRKRMSVYLENMPVRIWNELKAPFLGALAVGLSASTVTFFTLSVMRVSGEFCHYPFSLRLLLAILAGIGSYGLVSFLEKE